MARSKLYKKYMAIIPFPAPGRKDAKGLSLTERES